jgi:hypothetical protein
MNLEKSVRPPKTSQQDSFVLFENPLRFME